MCIMCKCISYTVMSYTHVPLVSLPRPPKGVTKMRNGMINGMMHEMGKLNSSKCCFIYAALFYQCKL